MVNSGKGIGTTEYLTL